MVLANVCIAITGMNLEEVVKLPREIDGLFHFAFRQASPIGCGLTN